MLLFQTPRNQPRRTDCYLCGVIFGNCGIPKCLCDQRSSEWSTICVHCRKLLLTWECLNCQQTFIREDLNKVFCSNRCTDAYKHRMVRRQKLDSFTVQPCFKCSRLTDQVYCLSCTKVRWLARESEQSRREKERFDKMASKKNALLETP